MPLSYLRIFIIHLLSVLVRSLPNTELCGQYENITDTSKVYTLSTNVWGKDNSGSSCIQVLNNATELTTTWSWLDNETLVHAYPNVNYDPIQRNPIQLSNLSSLDVKVSWSMQPSSSKSRSGMDTKGLATVNAKTNVAFDVFFDPDIKKAVNTTAPKYEIMVWIGKFGSILPIGATATTDTKKLPQQKIGKETFTLYQGPNDNGQLVFSWVANSNQTDFQGDLSPLVHYLWRHGLVLAANWIGVIQFGTEQKHATSNVTFTTSDFSIDAVQGTPKAAAGVLVMGVPSLWFVYGSSIIAILGLLW